MKSLNLKNTFAISDNHWGHQNIIKYSNRIFNSVEEMDEIMIQEWNSVIKNTDTVFYLGDFTFYRDKTKIDEILQRLNGNIIFIKGNHDDDELVKNPRFLKFRDYYELKIDGYKFVMMHYPLLEWNGSYRGTIHLHGHCHGNLGPITRRRVDVGVDSLGYKPRSLEQIIQYIKDNNCWD